MNKGCIKEFFPLCLFKAPVKVRTGSLLWDKHTVRCHCVTPCVHTCKQGEHFRTSPTPAVSWRNGMPWPTAELRGTSTNSPCLCFKPKPQLWPEHGTVPTLAAVTSHLKGAVTVPRMHRQLDAPESSSALSVSERHRHKRKYKHSDTESHTSSSPPQTNSPEPPQPCSNFSTLTYSWICP